MSKTVAIVQARLGSTRLPGKVLNTVGTRSLLSLLLERLSKSATLDQIVVAMPTSAQNDPLAAHVTELGVASFRGSEGDVLDRYYQAACAFGADRVVRITADCPLIDPALVDRLVVAFVESDADYATNSTPATYPDGLNAEIASIHALSRAWREASTPYDREHVTPYLRDSGHFNWFNLPNEVDLSAERWTVDEPEDLEVVRAVYEHFAPNVLFTWQDVLRFRQQEPDRFSVNQHLVRDEGSRLSTGQKLWKRAKRVIPGGSMLLSKRSELHLPDQWPAYFSKTEGCHVWDLDGRRYLDAYLMGVGTNTLGYSHPEVDAAVRTAIDAGNLSTLNSPEEVLLAEKLVAMHPWAEMVRFARSGGEINAVAVRLARAASGRDKVAFCGYHGWHDWYLAANLQGGDALLGHHLPGLEPRGVPAALAGTALPFRYNDYDELERLTQDPGVGVIFMEVQRNIDPAPQFLRRVRELATARGIVLVFDECTSGFRETFGGLHKKFGVEPDLATFGKTLGNGYCITAVIGRRSVMEHALDSFISSTFWTDRIGAAAALKTLEVMERERSWEHISTVGSAVMRAWKEAFNRHGLKATVSGLPALAGFAFEGPRAKAYKTLLTQELLDREILGGTSFYTCMAHSPSDLARYLDAFDGALDVIAECEAGRSVEDALRGPVCREGLYRLN